MNRHLRVAALALLAVLFLTKATSAQAAAAIQAPVTSVPAAGTASIEISRITGVPLLDGRDDEPFWQEVPLRGGFKEARPTEDAEPKQKTEFRIAYDATYIYVFVRAYDTAPDSIIKLLSRRDDQTASDQIVVMLDSYHDKRTGYEFTVNPLGVKADYAISNDGNEDGAWNAIWDVATAIDSLGWTAEYRIPFSQLRFELSDDMTFGFMIWRDLARHTAAITYPLYRQSKPGFPSQFGTLTGIRGVSRPDRLELTPYVLTQNEPDPTSVSGDREQNFHAGADLKYAVAPNVTLNATINPDFGQVEADPSVLNLSAFETFFNERRPFFVEGANIFSFPINCFAVVDCSTGEGLFYSRRIGKQPSLGGAYGDQDSPTATRILGAAKLSGRGGGGTSLGFLDAVTERVHNGTDQTLEPFTNYATLRINKDADAGNTSLGLMLTGVNRANDQWSSPYLHDAAYTGGLDARRRIGSYEFSGSVMGSYVMGSEEAIALTQQRPAHYYQRPDDDIQFDSTLTSLSGNSFEARFGKVGGEHTRFETGYSRRSAGFETNDIGFLNRADQQTWTNWAAYRWNRPAWFYQRINWNMNWWQYWNLNGLPTERAYNTNVHAQLNSRWWVHVGSTFGVGQTYCDRNCTRGGPALKVEPNISPWAGIQGDDRKPIVPGLWFNGNIADGGRSHYISLSPELQIKVASALSTTISADLSKNDDDSQWYGNFVDGSSITHYTFADLQQETVAITWRLNYTFTPNASFQLYASPFISKGTYTRIRELNDPRADNYDDRFQAYGDTAVTNNAGGFNVQEFRSNMVFRWEYRPGSTLFLVWSQGRGQFYPQEGNETFGGNFQNLFDSPAEDRFLVKVSYWFSK